jgi:endonuclease YncB( thermonuclease family)
VRRILSIALLLALAGAATVTATASKKAAPKTTGTVTQVLSGDTLLARVKSGKTTKTARVQILGVVAPAGSSCFANESTAQTRELAVGQRVSLVGDLKRGAYVTLPGGADLGAALLTRGAVQVDVWGTQSSRFATYVPLQEAAERAAAGMWGACAADVGVNMTGPRSGFPGDYLTYTASVTNAGPLAAPVRVELRPGNYAKQIFSVKSDLGTCTSKGWVAYCTVDGMAAGSTATISVVIRPTGPGALSARATATVLGCINAQCGNAALQDPNLGNDRAAQPTIIPGGAYGLPGHECDPSYPTVCIPPPPPEINCADIAPIKSFPVRRDVANPDPHHLDGNGDGIACQGDDY